MVYNKQFMCVNFPTELTLSMYLWMKLHPEKWIIFSRAKIANGFIYSFFAEGNNWLPISFLIDCDDWLGYPDDLLCDSFNPTGAVFMRQWIGSELVQILACRQFGTKPLSKPMVGYCSLEKNKLQWNINQNTKLFIHENTSDITSAK